MTRVPFLALGLVLATVGCHSTAAEVVQAQAANDFFCDEAKVKVAQVKDKPGSESDKETYTAEGCGKKGSWACGGWDSFNQRPICTPK